MKAVAVTEFGAAPQLLELPKPVPGPGEVLVRLAGAALNPFDRAISDGFLRHLPHDFPLILGIDGAGVVEGVGEGVERFAASDAVYGIFIAHHQPLGRGTLAEYVAVPGDALIGAAPSRVSLLQAAAAPTAGMSAVGLVEEAEVAAGQVVAIVGASGGVGSFAVQLAAARGAEVLATARPDAAARVGAWGATHVIDYGRDSLAKRVSELAPKGVDVLLDLVSDPAPFAANLALVRDGGRAVSLRYAAQAESLGSERIGVANFNLREHPDAARFLELLSAAIEAGLARPVIDAEIPLAEAPSAIASRGSSGARGKTVIVV